MRRQRQETAPLEVSLARWWSKKYNLPPTDTRYTELPLADHYEAFLEDMHDRRRELLDRLEDADARDRGELHAQLREVERILGEKSPVDERAAAWDTALDVGELPEDLTTLDPKIAARLRAHG